MGRVDVGGTGAKRSASFWVRRVQREILQVGGGYGIGIRTEEIEKERSR